MLNHLTLMGTLLEVKNDHIMIVADHELIRVELNEEVRPYLPQVNTTIGINGRIDSNNNIQIKKLTAISNNFMKEG